MLVIYLLLYITHVIRDEQAADQPRVRLDVEEVGGHSNGAQSERKLG